MIGADFIFEYYEIGARPFALCRRPDHLPYKAVGYDFGQKTLITDASLFMTADMDPEATPIDEAQFWAKLRDLGCRDRRINW